MLNHVPPFFLAVSFVSIGGRVGPVSSNKVASKRDEGPRGSESSGTRGRSRSRDNKNKRPSAGHKEFAHSEENKSGSVETLSEKADGKGAGANSSKGLSQQGK